MSKLASRDFAEGSYLMAQVAPHIEPLPCQVVETYSNTVEVSLVGNSRRILVPLKSVTPVPITADWLRQLGGADLSASVGRPTFGFVPICYDVPHSPFFFQVQACGEGWALIYDGHVLCELTGVHHLQALMWQLGRIWLTREKEVSHA